MAPGHHNPLLLRPTVTIERKHSQSKKTWYRKGGRNRQLLAQQKQAWYPGRLSPIKGPMCELGSGAEEEAEWQRRRPVDAAALVRMGVRVCDPQSRKAHSARRSIGGIPRTALNPGGGAGGAHSFASHQTNGNPCTKTAVDGRVAIEIRGSDADRCPPFRRG